MKKTAILALILALALSGCGRKQAEKPDEQIDNSYKGGETQTEEAVPEEELHYFLPVEDEEVIAAGRAAASAMLDCFQKLDYEGALANVREEDREMLDVDSARSNAAYTALLPRMSYELGDCLTENGVNYISAKITAPSMSEVYGQVFIRMNDAMMSGEVTTAEEAAEFNDRSLVEVLESGEINNTSTDVYIRLDAGGDGTLRASLTPELLNAMLGDIQNAANEINETVNETANSYNAAKAAGDLD